MKNTSLTYSIIVAALLLFAGCSDLKNDKATNPTTVSVHGEGFANPKSANFHAVLIKSKNYDTQACKQCHGGDYSGGTAEKSCLTCHNKPNGPENCTTCHGSVNAAPPKDLSNNTSPSVLTVGAHQKHLLGGILGNAVACKECHTVPASVLSVGHIDGVARAEVNFDTLSVFYKSNVMYNDGSCANTYCHGNFTNGNAKVMTWNDTTASATECGSCHGDITKTTLADKAVPKQVSQGGSHPNLNGAACSSCHGHVINSSMQFLDLSKHINGTIDF
ncbi:MAG: CxxxxCH/CxxCH domain-containing protein [Bacteroidota bacterium]|jgi:predicted CxxxxCH...CXXCH cytochrome family protein